MTRVRVRQVITLGLAAVSVGLLTGAGCLPPVNQGQNDQDIPPVADCTGNELPLANLDFPLGVTAVPAGDIPFQWDVQDPEGRRVRSRLFVGTDPNVFASEPVTTVISDPNELSSGALVTLDTEGTYFWGVEIFDGCETIQRPASGTGQEFTVGAGLVGRDDLAAIQLCPRPGLAARPDTTFSWAGLDVVPTSVRVFISRPGVTDPFDNPLRVLDVIPPTATQVSLSAAETLTIGQTYSWGLRAENADGVLFSGGGESGVSFTVQANIAPSGTLLDPANETVVADGGSLVLRWNADAGNCEDTLTTRVLLVSLANVSIPDFDIPDLQFVIAPGGFELNVGTAVPAGRWAWAVEVSDGTETLLLPSGLNDGRDFRTFIRNPGPRFTAVPALDNRECQVDSFDLTGIAFGYTDDNGAGSVAVRLVYGSDPNTVFASPVADLAFDPTGFGQTADNAFVVIHQAPQFLGNCPDFPQGPGVYGVELDDGVNPPVQRLVNVNFADCNANTIPDSLELATGTPDCNTNGVPDACDIALGTSADCNGNNVPDECDIALGTSFDRNQNGVPDECESFLLVGASARFLLDVNPTSGVATARSGLALSGYPNVLGIAIDPAGRVYGVDTDENVLVRFDRASRNVDRIGLLPRTPSAIAFDAANNLLYATAFAPPELWRIDVTTGAVTIITAPNLPAIEDLAFDSAGARLFALPAGQTQVFLVNTDTGGLTLVPVQPDVGDLTGLAFLPAAGLLVSIEPPSGRVITMNPDNGDTVLGIFLDRGIPGAQLAFDAARAQLVATIVTLGRNLVSPTTLFSVDPAGGFVLPIDAWGFALDGLALHPTQQRLFGYDPVSSLLVTIDPATFRPTPIAPTTQPVNDTLRSLAFNPTVGAFWSLSQFTDILYQFDLASGAAAPLAQLGQSAFTFESIEFAPPGNSLYALSSFPNQLVRVQPGDPNQPYVNIGNPLTFSADGMAFDPDPGVFFATDEFGGVFGQIALDGTSTVLTPTLVSAAGLTYDPTLDRLWASGDGLYQIDTTIPQARARGCLGFQTLGMAVDPRTNTIFAGGFSGFSDGMLVNVDYVSGEATTVGPLGNNLNLVTGPCNDPDTGTFFIVTQTSEDPSVLATVNVATGATTPLVPVGFADIRAIAFETTTDRLLAAVRITGAAVSYQLVSIDRATGQFTNIGTPVIGLSVEALTYDWTANVLYGATSNGQLVIVNTANGALTPIGSLGHRNVRSLGAGFLIGSTLINHPVLHTPEIGPARSVEFLPATAA